MKFSELLLNQEIIIQLNWGEKKIEFRSNIIAKEEGAILTTPYIHNGSELELNITQDKGVVCSVFADNPVTNQRVSWKNVELTTVNRNGKNLYRIKTYGFNNIGSLDDRRLHERVVVNAEGFVFDGQLGNSVRVNIYDISDIGISFFAPTSFAPKSQQVTVTFSDSIDKKSFEVRVDCSITRISIENGKSKVGCKILGENKDYLLYGFMKRLKFKNSNKIKEADENVITVSDQNQEENSN